MPDLVVNKFGGLDGRRQEISALAGTLAKCINAHLNRGGEIQKRYALESYASLPSTVGATYGLASDGTNLYAFGSVTAAQLSMPAGVSYQQLAHPSGPSIYMTALLDWALFNGQIYAVAQYSDGSIKHFYNGSLVTDIFDGKARGSFEITGGTSSTVANGISSVKVNGVEVLNVFKTLGSSISELAKSVAAQITSYTSSPDYTGVNNNSTVTIVASASGTSSNGLVVSVTCSGDVTVGNLVNMANGQDSPPGDPGSTVLTLGDKEYTVASKNINFSATRDATKFNTTYEGAGFITPAMHSTGAAAPVALGTFVNPQGSAGQTLLVLCREAIQVWHVEADDDNNEMLQLIEDAGTRADNANVGFRNQHVFISHNGICAISRTGDSSNVAEVVEIGAPINEELLAYMATLTQDQQDAAVAIVEPRDRRLWICVGYRVYVLSVFPEAGVGGWSRYDLDFIVTDLAILNRRLYARSGNSVYLYGGSTGSTYDACRVTVRPSYLDAGRPAGFKTLLGIDLGIVGEWNVAIGIPVDGTSTLSTIGNFVGTTFNSPTTALAGRETNIAIEMVHEKTEAAIVSQFMLHYKTDATVET